MSRKEADAAEVGVASTSSPSSTLKTSGKQDLLMRFFESDFFDAWIAVTYLHKSLANNVHDYLCSRLYTLPEADVERYLSQLCQLCVSRPDTPLEDVLVDLCAQSLRIAVKTYWLLLAISQDNPKNTHVAALRDKCEQAALEGHWDLPFKDARLPSPIKNSRSTIAWLKMHNHQPLTPPANGNSATAAEGSSSPIAVATPNTASRLAELRGMEVARGSSPDIVPRMSRWRSGTLSPDVPSRPLSPDGLGKGLHSSVFMDTGVEGLLYESTPLDIRERRQRLLSPNEPGTEYYTPESGGSGYSGSQPGSGARWRRQHGDSQSPFGTSTDGDEPMSSPNSPRRRETTFGATLDFVDALCTASSNLTVFQPEDRQWALQKALHSINAEMDRAAKAGVAIWWPMGRSLQQRVVRLAYKESKLLNSREKAPFTLFVEVLNEAAAEAEAAAEKEAQAAAMAAAVAGSMVHKLPPLPQEMAIDPAAAEAAAGGIPWVSHHHRRSSSVDTASSSLLAAAAVAAVQGSSAAAGGNGRALGTPGAPWDNFTALTTPIQGRESTATPEPGPGPAAPATDPPISLISQRSEASTFATDLSLADFASEASHSPPGKRPFSGASTSGHGEQLDGSGEGSLPLPNAPSSPLPPRPRGSIQGGGHWIGGSNVKLHPVPTADLNSGLNMALAALRGEAPSVAVRLQVLDDTPVATPTQGMSRTNSGVGSYASSGSDSTTPAEAAAMLAAAANSSKGGSRAAVHPEPQGAAFEAALVSSKPLTCEKNGWMCKVGLCKTCNALAKAPSSQPSTPPSAKTLIQASPAPASETSTEKEGVPEAVQPPPAKIPRVKVLFTVQGGVNLSIKRAHGHQRMPSHEALLHVAKEHKLPVPPPAMLPSTPEGPSVPAANLSPLPSPTDVPSSPVREDEHKTVHGEKWSTLRSRLRAASPHGARPGWDVRCVIVKSGDDCRQELLAMQLISTFHEVFAEAQLPLWLRPFEVLVTSNRTALIEMVPNAPSIHAIKAKRPPGTSLRDHFAAEFGEGTPLFKRAQRNFVESMAAYSLVCYLLQIRDRHNGNILLDDVGHVIHIDFGFMLSNSPGGVNFESAPFKLTRELLEVMDSDPEGLPSELFDYYKVLLIQGFLAVRRHSDRITLLVDMMSSSGCPCFKSRVAAVQGLKKRFALGMPEPAVVEVVLGLVSDSLDAWRTRQYDYYQRVLNGIL